MNGKPPFCRNNKETSYEIYVRILKGDLKFPRKFHKPAKHLVKQLLNHNLEERVVDPEEIRKSEWLECDWQGVRERRVIPPFRPK